MDDRDKPQGKPGTPDGSMDDVLASIRALVTAETSSRLGGADEVLMLTPDMRAGVEPGADEPTGHAGRVLAEGIGGEPAPPAAPILDEEAIRHLVNRIAREELQGELGERIGRNLRKLIRRELAQLEQERHAGPD